MHTVSRLKLYISTSINCHNHTIISYCFLTVYDLWGPLLGYDLLYQDSRLFCCLSQLVTSLCAAYSLHIHLNKFYFIIQDNTWLSSTCFILYLRNSLLRQYKEEFIASKDCQKLYYWKFSKWSVYRIYCQFL